MPNIKGTASMKHVVAILNALNAPQKTAELSIAGPGAEVEVGFVIASTCNERDKGCELSIVIGDPKDR